MKLDEGQSLVHDALDLKKVVKHTGVTLEYIKLSQLIKLNNNMENLINLLTPVKEDPKTEEPVKAEVKKVGKSVETKKKVEVKATEK